MNNYGNALTWDDLANIYDSQHNGRKARTLQMETIFDWAKKQSDKFFVCLKEGTIHLRNTKESPTNSSVACKICNTTFVNNEGASYREGLGFICIKCHKQPCPNGSAVEVEKLTKT